jgi:hypothetical protein
MANKASDGEQFFRRFFVAGATLPQKINSKPAANAGVTVYPRAIDSLMPTVSYKA